RPRAGHAPAHGDGGAPDREPDRAGPDLRRVAAGAAGGLVRPRSGGLLGGAAGARVAVPAPALLRGLEPGPRVRGATPGLLPVARAGADLAARVAAGAARPGLRRALGR